MLLAITENGEVRIYPLHPHATNNGIINICRRHGYNNNNCRAFYISAQDPFDQTHLSNPVYINPMAVDIDNLLHPDKQTMPLFLETKP